MLRHSLGTVKRPMTWIIRTCSRSNCFANFTPAGTRIHNQGDLCAFSRGSCANIMIFRLLFTYRLMLRAAHSKHMGHKQREITAVSKRPAKTARTAAAASKKRKGRSTYYEGSFVGSSHAAKRSSSGASAGANKREAESAASAQIKNEVPSLHMFVNLDYFIYNATKLLLILYVCCCIVF